MPRLSRKNRLPFLLTLGVLTLALAVAVWRAQAGTSALRRELREQQDRAREEAGARRAREARLPPDAEVPARRAVDATRESLPREAGQLAAGIKRLRETIAARESAARSAPTPIRPASPVPVSPWTHAGRHDPLSTFRSIQWAINAGEVAALEGMITLEAEAQRAAERFFSSLDRQSQAEYGDPRRLVAAVMAARSRSDIRDAQELSAEWTGTGAVAVRLRLTVGQQSSREITLRFQREPEGWRLLVPAKIITSYRNLILGVERPDDSSARNLP